MPIAATGYIKARHRWTWHLWQGRFGAVAMDEAHLGAAVRYVALNPVRAKLVQRAQDWAWSGARAHLAEADDPLVTVAPVLERYGRFADSLGDPLADAEAWRALRMSETTGRPLGSGTWLEALEAQPLSTIEFSGRFAPSNRFNRAMRAGRPPPAGRARTMPPVTG